jgi:nucleoside-diphosphate-sugar epimerase
MSKSMNALFIGGTGTISKAISVKLVKDGWDLTLLNRGIRSEEIPGTRQLTGDINDEAGIKDTIRGKYFDVIVDFVAYVPEHIKRDIRLFTGMSRQYIFISSASAYQKPLSNTVITESTPLCNPYWQYSRDKIACEDLLIAEYRLNGFPVTIVRPSHTYDDAHIPLAIHGKKGAWQVVQRMMESKSVPLSGDGTSLWTVTHARDFAQGFIGLLANPHALGEAVHITTDEIQSWNMIYTAVANALGVTFKPCYVPATVLAESKLYDFRGSLLGDKSVSVIFDNSKIKRLVPGFVCNIRFDQGVSTIIANLLSHQELQVADEEFDNFCNNLDELMSTVKGKIQ